MKILANRLNPLCNEIIGPSQQAFIAKRSIMDTALDIITVLRNQDDQSKQHWLLFLDQQKAFDRISHQFMNLILEKMNFDSKFINIINTLFSTQQAYISDHGRISEPFKVNRGVRQGDPLSPLLYILSINPLIQAIHNKIRGINLQGQLFKVAAYADDLTIGIGSHVDWSNLIAILQKYEQASNSRINKTKSILAPLTVNARRIELPDMNSFKLLENENTSFKILGFEIDSKGNINKDLWPLLTKRIQKNIQNLSSRNLSFKGKILIAKSLLVSKIWYTAYLLPPSRKQLNIINALICN
jgi:hypothetical protein